MTLVNVLLVLGMMEFTALFSTFPSMITEARKASREQYAAETYCAMVDAWFCHNRVVTLKLLHAVLFIAIVCATVLLGNAYYCANVLAPEALRGIDPLGMQASSIEAIRHVMLVVPDWSYVCVAIVDAFVFVALAWVAVANQVPHDVGRLLNPTGKAPE